MPSFVHTWLERAMAGPNGDLRQRVLHEISRSTVSDVIEEELLLRRLEALAGPEEEPGGGSG